MKLTAPAILYEGEECVNLHLHSPHAFLAWCPVDAESTLHGIVAFVASVLLTEACMKKRYVHVTGRGGQ
jgi:hypothetical protein